jgi:hypothetical protein
MSEGLTSEQIIKIILGILVVAAVLIGLFLIFKSKILDYFKQLPVGNDTLTFFIGLIK